MQMPALCFAKNIKEDFLQASFSVAESPKSSYFALWRVTKDDTKVKGEQGCWERLILYKRNNLL